MHWKVELHVGAAQTRGNDFAVKGFLSTNVILLVIQMQEVL